MARMKGEARLGQRGQGWGDGRRERKGAEVEPTSLSPFGSLSSFPASPRRRPGPTLLRPASFPSALVLGLAWLFLAASSAFHRVVYLCAPNAAARRTERSCKVPPEVQPIRVSPERKFVPLPITRTCRPLHRCRSPRADKEREEKRRRRAKTERWPRWWWRVIERKKPCTGGRRSPGSAFSCCTPYTYISNRAI